MNFIWETWHRVPDGAEREVAGRLLRRLLVLLLRPLGDRVDHRVQVGALPLDVAPPLVAAGHFPLPVVWLVFHESLPSVPEADRAPHQWFAVSMWVRSSSLSHG